MKNKIIGIAKNYPNKLYSYPIFFSKPWSSIITQRNNLGNQNILYIMENCNIHYELELGVIIYNKANSIDKANYLDYIGGYCLCLDITDKQRSPLVNNDYSPQLLSKGMDNFLPIGDFIEKESIADLNNIRLELYINNLLIQKGNISQLVYSIDEQIAILSHHCTLNKGDIILTGFFPSGNNEKMSLNDEIVGKAVDNKSNKVISSIEFIVSDKIESIRKL